MKYLLGIILFFPLGLLAQSDTLQVKLDSIVKEADLIYAHEKAAWNSSDLAMQLPSVTNDYGGYAVILEESQVEVIYLDKERKSVTLKHIFSYSDLYSPKETIDKKTPLSEKELEITSALENFHESLNRDFKKYDIEIFDGYNFNVVMTPAKGGYHFYLILGTTEDYVIPFGGDYFFKTNENGKIQEWKRFHKTVIPAMTRMEGDLVPISFTHSHLKMTPYITSTDIATFRLYGKDLYNMNTFSVLSTALDMTFVYDAVTNKVSYKSEDD